MNVILYHTLNGTSVPDEDKMGMGQIAINHAEGSEQLFIKNTSGNIVSFLPLNIWKGTLEEYNAIENKDDDCLYFVVDVLNSIEETDGNTAIE